MVAATGKDWLVQEEPKFCFCLDLQRGVFVCTFVSWIFWFSAAILYIPYCLQLAPVNYVIDGKVYNTIEEYNSTVDVIVNKVKLRGFEIVVRFFF